MPLAVFPKCFIPAFLAGRMSIESWIELAARDLDVDGLEFYWPTLDGTPQQLERVRGLLKAHQLAAPMMCYSPDFINKSPEVRRAEVEKQKRVIEGAATLGCQYCRVLSGQRNPEISRRDGVAMAAEGINSLVPFAAERGICLVLENHYKDAHWRFPEFAQRLEVYLDLLEEIPESPFFGVNFDPSNALLAGDDPVAFLEAVKGRIRTMHASDRFFVGGNLEDLRRLELDAQTGYASILQHGVIGRGSIDYNKLFAILRDVSFHGWISIEDGDDPALGVQHLQESAVFLRQKMAEYNVG